MACILVPATEAIIVTAVNKLSSKKEGLQAADVRAVENRKLSFHDKVKWLQNMLWGGSALLTFEHVWHGEMVPWFPFLTAAGNAADLQKMLGEMSTTGVTMAVLVTAVWGFMLWGSHVIEQRELTARSLAK